MATNIQLNYRTLTSNNSDSDSDSNEEDVEEDVEEDEDELDEDELIQPLANLKVKEVKKVKDIDNKSNINKAAELFLQMKYFKNQAAVSGKFHKKHEEAVADVLIQSGFNKFKPEKKLTQKIVANWMNVPINSIQFPVGCFIEQPLGSNNSPDFLVKISENFILPIEAKSAKSMKPLYNSGSIKSDYLYVFSSEKLNKTTIFKGSYIITVEQDKLIEEHIKKSRSMDEELNKQLALYDTNMRGISYYTRPMIGQKGKAKYTDYFGHENRKEVEDKTVGWIKGVAPF